MNIIITDGRKTVGMVLNRIIQTGISLTSTKLPQASIKRSTRHITGVLPGVAPFY